MQNIVGDEVPLHYTTPTHSFPPRFDMRSLKMPFQAFMIRPHLGKSDDPSIKRIFRCIISDASIVHARCLQKLFQLRQNFRHLIGRKSEKTDDNDFGIHKHSITFSFSTAT